MLKSQQEFVPYSCNLAAAVRRMSVILTITTEHYINVGVTRTLMHLANLSRLHIPYSPEVFRMLSDVIGTNIARMFINILLGLFTSAG